MRPLNITFNKETGIKNTLLVHFEGDFDGASKDNLEEVKKEIDTYPENTSMIFDFSQLNYLNSFAMSQMVAWHNTLESKGGNVIIIGMNDHVKDIFMVLGVDTVFKIYDTLEEAKMDMV